MKSYIVDNKGEIEQHSLSKSILLHLFPGILLVTCYLLIAPVIIDMGYPSMFGLILAIPLSSVPFQLGWLLYEGKKRNGKLSLKEIVLYENRITRKQYFIYVPILIVWGAVLLGSLPILVDEYIINKMFFWIPSWFNVTEFIPNIANYENTKLLIMIFAGIIFNGLLGPLVEELYYRGYLLPRLSKFNRKAPLINAILFSVYHFHRPWQLFNMFLFALPMSYLVWKHKDIKIGLLTHMLLNIFSMISMIPLLFI